MSLPESAPLNPYPGLVPFGERDASRFFGRKREIDEILDRLRTHRLLAVTGVSGCGKSSLISAGVIPILRPSYWRICVMSPGNNPLASMRAALDAPEDWPATSVDLTDHARDLLKEDEGLLLIVDQFEEVFQYRKEQMAKDGGNAASLFVNLLLEASAQLDIPVYVLLTMRADFLGDCSQFRGLPEALNDCYYLVPRMTRMQQQEAIEGPLRIRNESIQTALVEHLLNDAVEDPDQLPVLQHLLKRLWVNWDKEGRVTGRPINMEDYSDVGGWGKALNYDAEHVLQSFESEQGAIEQVFRWITDRGTGEKPVRRPQPFATCVEISGLERERLAEIICAFRKRDLLRWDGSRNANVDLMHESVMWKWSRLQNWINNEIRDEAQLRFLSQSAEQNNPLTGQALELAKKWWSGSASQKCWAKRYLALDKLNQIEDLILKSQRLKARSLKIVLATLISLICAGLAVAIWDFRKQRDAAEDARLVASIGESLHDDPERSLILGLYAWGKHRAMVPGLEESLHASVSESHNRLTINGHQDHVLSVSWAPDGNRLATASDDQTAVVWDSATGRRLVSLEGHQGPVWDVSWSPDGKLLATACADMETRVFDSTTGALLHTLTPHGGPVRSVAWSKDGTKLATGSNDKTARIWDAKAGTLQRILKGHKGSVRSVAWSQDGTKLATASDDGTARIWASNGRSLHILVGHQRNVLSVAWSKDGSKLATASSDQTSRIWDAVSGRELLTLLGHDAAVASVAWSMDGSRLATASSDRTARVWQADNGRLLLVLRGHENAVRCVAWAPDNRRLATASYDRTAKVWDLQGNHELLLMQGPTRSIAWSPDGAKLAAPIEGNRVRLYNTNSGRELLELRGHESPVLSVKWSHDGQEIATASADGTARIWDATGHEVCLLRGNAGNIWKVAWSPDGSKLATASDTTARIWESRTGREMFVLHHDGIVWSVAWSPDGTKLASASDDKTVKIWDSSAGHELFTLRGHQAAVRSVDWSPDGKKIATAGDDKIAKVWNSASGKELLILLGHQDSIEDIAWSPDGQRLATGARDNTAVVWDAATGQEVLVLHGHNSWVQSVSWSPDGQRLASADADRIGQVYAATETELLRLVRSRITRKLTPDECKRYFMTGTCPPLP